MTPTMRFIPTDLSVLLAAFLFATHLPCQSAGARGGVYQNYASTQAQRKPDLPSEAVERYIVITGSVEKRVKPTEVRVVLAVVTDFVKPEDSAQANALKRADLIKAFVELGVPRDKIVGDFISMLPVHEWFIEDRRGRDVAVERPVRFRAQYNLHVSVADEKAAQELIRKAFELGVPDVLAVDHWAANIDEKKTEALKEALSQARKKARLLLGDYLGCEPLPINLREDTRVLSPMHLYASFENDVNSGFHQSWGGDRNMPTVDAPRPGQTYYHGFGGQVDRRDSGLPMRPEISVVSTVSLYFRSPAADRK